MNNPAQPIPYRTRKERGILTIAVYAERKLVDKLDRLAKKNRRSRSAEVSAIIESVCR